MRTPDFSRQLKVAGMTPAAQEALARARVIIFGAGGLAATAAPWLAAAGVGHLTIVDADRIAASNLHRQTPYTYADLGAKKATTLAAYCQARMADGAQCEAIAQTLDGEVLLAALRAHDLALDCTDSRHFAYQLNDAALITATPVVYANAAALGGQLFTLHPSRDAPCWRCLWPEDIAPGGNCDALGVLGPVPATLGLWQALEALKILTGFAAPLAGEVLQYDFATMRQTRIRVPRRAACNHQPQAPAAPIHAELTIALTQHWRIIDIRSAAERAALAPPFASDHIPMPELLASPAAHLRPKETTLLICASGQRATHTARTLRTQGHTQVFAYGKVWAEAKNPPPAAGTTRPAREGNSA
ncbi:MAG: ThiF family adenylyltransferase [Cardiobacterium sp.]